MDQIKIGGFIKTLRKEQGLTQEQLAERLYVSRRTVSRWETGSNLPDLDVLMELADTFRVDLRELLDGERKDGQMEKDLKKTVAQVADYSNEQKQKVTARMHVLFITGLIAVNLYLVLEMLGKEENFLGGLCLGITMGMMAVGVIMTSRYGARLRAAKQRLLHRLVHGKQEN